MDVNDRDLERSALRTEALREGGYALSASYDPRSARIVVELSTGVQFAVPASRLEGLAEATPGQLQEIEISPSGLGLHWPELDADIYVPALLRGIFGSKAWMAAELGAAGGRARSSAKASAARENGRKGGRPKKLGTA